MCTANLEWNCGFDDGFAHFLTVDSQIMNILFWTKGYSQALQMAATCLPHFSCGCTFWKLQEEKLLRQLPAKSPLQCRSHRGKRGIAYTINRRNHMSLQRFKNCWKKSRCTVKPLRWNTHRHSWRSRRDFANSAFESRLKTNLKERNYLQRLAYIIFSFLFWNKILLLLHLTPKKKMPTNFNRTKLWNL